jgi:hypothetical protein
MDENKKYLLTFGTIFVVIIGWLFISEGRQSNQISPVTVPTVVISNTPMPTTSQVLGVTNSVVQKNMDQFKIEDLTVGTGEAALAGKKVTVNYLGTLTNGTKFDSSYDRGTPFSFLLGAGQVIKGWDQGVVGMKIGGKRRLTIPAELGYGSQGAGNAIPPNATLIFEVELLKVE